jgi:16S rRNA (adenine1518-N6/adenine1519-N6)-dimethyltransferase
MKHQHKKSFGQHFLHDTAVIDQIVRAINPQQGQSLIEIGPGTGALTSVVLSMISELHAIELDKDLLIPLEQKFSSQGLILHHADALMFDFLSLFKLSRRKWRVFGNLPYNVSSPLLFRLLTLADWVDDQYFMLQKEVVDRMVAVPSTPDYGRLSVMLQARYHMSEICVVEPESFDPPPKVRSSVVRMRPHDWYVGLDWNAFERLIRAAFSQRRKMLRNTLADYHQQLPLEEAGILSTARAEDIEISQYVNYLQLLSKVL